MDTNISIDLEHTVASRRVLLTSGAALALLGASSLRAQTQLHPMEVWKSPTCGCCTV